MLRERDGLVIISRDVIFDEGAKGKGVVEVISDPTEDLPTSEEGGAQVPTTVENQPPADLGRHGPTQGPPERTGAQNPTAGHFGKLSELRREESAEPEEVEEDLGNPPAAAQRYQARARRAPGEWYRANLAAEPAAGEDHPKGSGEHPEPQSYQEAVGGEESDL